MNVTITVVTVHVITKGDWSISQVVWTHFVLKKMVSQHLEKLLHILTRQGNKGEKWFKNLPLLIQNNHLQEYKNIKCWEASGERGTLVHTL